ncbi:DUF4245 domain-containing protein [Streptomyces sp. HK10]|uniref:DUF4245 domain-containing protein n=1 Tax=Streptomyces sp. HK10 TaxID=3373255 RepID=UPI003747C781
MASTENKRGRQTARDMVLSLLVILLGAGFVYLLVPHDDSLDPVRPVGYDVELATARRAAPYPVAAPAGLPDTWRATSVGYKRQSDLGAVWHLGFMDPDDQYAAVEQSDGEPEKFIGSVTHGAEPADRTQRAGGEEWERYEGAKYDALVRRESGVTTVVTGTASFESLARLAAALEAERAGVPGGTGGSGEAAGESGKPPETGAPGKD